MKLAVGADHAGFPLKVQLLRWLREQGHEVQDFGTFSSASVDYPDQAAAVARAVACGAFERGLLVCGSGQGMAIAANKIDGIRAALCHDPASALLARGHNDANILTLGGRVVSESLAEEIVRTFLSTSWEGGRHEPRIAKIHALEKAPGEPCQPMKP